MSETLEIYQKLRQDMDHKEAVRRLEEMGGELDSQTREAMEIENAWKELEKKTITYHVKK